MSSRSRLRSVSPRVVAAFVSIAAVLCVLVLGFVVLSDDGGGGDQGGNDAAGGGADQSTPSPTFVSKLPETDETVSPPATTPPAVEVVPPPPGFSPAVPQSSETECQVRSAAAVLAWKRSEPRGDQQVELVSDFDEFVPGHYLSSQTLSSDSVSLTWPGLIPGVIYFWRVTTRVDGSWVVSQSAQFQTETCPQPDEAASRR